jgi:urease accessory protein
MMSSIKVTQPVVDQLVLQGSKVDFLEVEWYETAKSRMRKRTLNGVEILLDRSDRSSLQDGDLLYVSDEVAIKLRISPCHCIVLRPATLPEAGRICFDIGNKHLPIFLTEQNEICLAYDANLFDMLGGAGYEPVIEERVLYPYEMVKAYGNKSSI